MYAYTAPVNLSISASSSETAKQGDDFGPLPAAIKEIIKMCMCVCVCKVRRTKWAETVVPTHSFPDALFMISVLFP